MNIESAFHNIAKLLDDEGKRKFVEDIKSMKSLIESDRQRLLKHICLGLLYSGYKNDFDKNAVDIFIDCTVNGEKPLRDLNYPSFLKNYKYSFRELYDIKRGLLEVELGDAGVEKEERVGPTYLGYKLLSCICNDFERLITEALEGTPMGSALITKYENTQTKFLLVYPENVGCYTFLGWDFNDSNDLNPGDLIDKIVRVIFNGDWTKIGGRLNARLNPRIDCILPASLDSTRAMYLFRINFPESAMKEINGKAQTLMQSSMAKSKDYCYASIEQMLDSDWSPNPYKYPSIRCGNKVRTFALLRKMESEFIKSGKDIKAVIKVIERCSKEELKVLNYVLKRDNSYHTEIKDQISKLLV